MDYDIFDEFFETILNQVENYIPFIVCAICIIFIVFVIQLVHFLRKRHSEEKNDYDSF